MVIARGTLISAENFNNLAELTNLVFADATPDAAYVPIIASNLPSNFAASNMIFWISENDPAFQTVSPGLGPFQLSVIPIAGDFVIVQIGDEVKKQGYSINLITGMITFTAPLPVATRVMVFNRTSHIFGWGQTAVDEVAIASTVNVADLNKIIDRSNIMLARIGDDSEVDRLLPQTNVLAIHKNQLNTIIQSEVIDTSLHITTTLADLIEHTSISRTTAWNDKLQGSFSFVFQNYQQARYFFNSGGQLRTRLAVTGDVANPGTLTWKGIADAMGSLILSWDRATQSGFGGVSNLKGFYHLTDEWQTIFSSGGPGGGPGYNYSYSYSYSYGYGYSGYSNLRAIFDAKYSIVNTSEFSIDIRVVMEDLDYNFEPTTGTVSLTALSRNPADISVEEVDYSISPPTVAILENFDSINNS